MRMEPNKTSENLTPEEEDAINLYIRLMNGIKNDRVKQANIIYDKDLSELNAKVVKLKPKLNKSLRSAIESYGFFLQMSNKISTITRLYDLFLETKLNMAYNMHNISSSAAEYTGASLPNVYNESAHRYSSDTLGHNNGAQKPVRPTIDTQSVRPRGSRVASFTGSQVSEVEKRKQGPFVDSPYSHPEQSRYDNQSQKYGLTNRSRGNLQTTPYPVDDGSQYPGYRKVYPEPNERRRSQLSYGGNMSNHGSSHFMPSPSTFLPGDANTRNKPSDGPDIENGSSTPNESSFEPSAPNFEPSAPNFEPSAPSFEPSAPNFEPSAPNFEPSAPNFEPNAPNFESNAPNYEQTEETFVPEDKGELEYGPEANLPSTYNLKTYRESSSPTVSKNESKRRSVYPSEPSYLPEDNSDSESVASMYPPVPGFSEEEDKTPEPHKEHASTRFPSLSDLKDLNSSGTSLPDVRKTLSRESKRYKSEPEPLIEL